MVYVEMPKRRSDDIQERVRVACLKAEIVRDMFTCVMSGNVAVFIGDMYVLAKSPKNPGALQLSCIKCGEPFSDLQIRDPEQLVRDFPYCSKFGIYNL